MDSGWTQLVLVVAFFSIFGAMAALYFLPSIVAKRRNHPRYEQILLFNFLLGWTVVGWVAALVEARRYPSKGPTSTAASTSSAWPTPANRTTDLEPEDARPLGWWDRLNARIRGMGRR
jgi:hypothetical protein